MDIAVAQQFLRENENAVLATWRREGRLQMSPVTVGLDAAGRAIIASRETTYKVRNLRRDRLLPTGVRETRFSMAYSHPYDMNPMTWRPS